MIFILNAAVWSVLTKAPDFSYSSELTPSCSRTAVRIFRSVKLFCYICKLTILEYLGVPIAAFLRSRNYSSTFSRNLIYKMTKSLNIFIYSSISNTPFSLGITHIGAKSSRTFLTSLYWLISSFSSFLTFWALSATNFSLYNFIILLSYFTSLSCKILCSVIARYKSTSLMSYFILILS